MKEMTAAIIIKDRKILLVHNTKHSGLRIEPPGGKKEDNETLNECVIREVKEELNITISPVKLFGVYKTNSPEGAFKVFMYLSKIIGGEIKLNEPDKISDFGWYSLEQLRSFKENGVLVPNLCSALDELKEYIN